MHERVLPHGHSTRFQIKDLIDRQCLPRRQPQKKTKKRFWRKRRFYILLTCFLIGISSRNIIAHRLIVHIGAGVLDTEVELDHIHIGWGSLEITGLRANEPANSPHPLLSIKQINVEIASLGDLFAGVPVRRLRIDSPQLHLRLDEKGQLLSRFPPLPQSEQGDSPAQLPFHQISIRDARLVVHQAGKPALTITGNQLSIVAHEGLVGNATLTTESLSWNRSRLSEFLTAEIALTMERVTLRRLQGQFAEGQVNGKAEVSWQGQPRGNFEFSVANVNLRRASTPFLGSQQAATGSASISLRGRIDSTVSGRLKLDVDNAEFADLSIRRVRIPVDWSYSIDSNIARWQLRAGTIEAGGGRLHIDSEGSYSRSLTMNSSVRIERVDSSRLMRGRSFGVGVIDGNCTLQARRTNSLDRMTGTFDIELSQTRAMEMPILDQLPQMIQVPALGTNSADRQGGYLYGRLGSGLIHLDELALTQSNVQLLMDGTSTLDGRLDLAVSVSTNSNGPINDLLNLLDSPVMAAGAAPVAMVARANDILKSRVVHADISGTVQRPSIRLNPGKQLSQDAIRFFLKATVGTQVADAATSYQRNRRTRR